MPNNVVNRQPLTDAASKSLAPAYADIIRSLGGRVRLLIEMITGASNFATEPAAAPLNPQGRGCGVDFSGPPFGSAWRTPMWWVGGIKEDVSVDWEGQQQVGVVKASSPLELDIHFWNRPHQPFAGAPHSRCYLAFRAYKAATSATLTAVFTRPGQDAALDRSSSVSVTSTNETTFEVTDAYWDVTGGKNRIRLRFTTDHDVTVTCALGFQKAKRSH